MRDPYPPAPVLALGADRLVLPRPVAIPLRSTTKLGRLREISEAYEKIAKGIDAIPGRKPLSDRMEVGE